MEGTNVERGREILGHIHRQGSVGVVQTGADASVIFVPTHVLIMSTAGMPSVMHTTSGSSVTQRYRRCR
jgi:hypothetical protein